MEPDIGSPYGGIAAVFLNQKDGTFLPPPKNFSSGGSVPDKVIAGDFNGDGHLDLIVSNYGSDGAGAHPMLLLGLGNGKFDLPRSFTPTTRPRDVIAADFNNDKRLDVVLWGQSHVAIELQSPDGKLGDFSIITRRGYLASGDFNGDGIEDLYVAIPFGASAYQVFLGNGDGTFRQIH